MIVQSGVTATKRAAHIIAGSGAHRQSAFTMSKQMQHATEGDPIRELESANRTACTQGMRGLLLAMNHRDADKQL